MLFPLHAKGDEWRDILNQPGLIPAFFVMSSSTLSLIESSAACNRRILVLDAR